MTYILSKSTREAAKAMGPDQHAPRLDRAATFQYAIDSRQPYIPDLKLVSLPENHFTLHSAMLIPIVVDGKSLGLAGFANGRYNFKEDPEILFESLANAWITVISEAVKENTIQSNIISNTLPQHVVDRYLAMEYEMTKRSDRSSSSSRHEVVI